MVIKASDFYLDLAWDKNADSVTLHTPTDNVGIQTIPTARLHLPAGTTTPYSAPLKFTGGSLLSNLEDGAFEYDGTYLYITSQNVRKKLLESSFGIQGSGTLGKLSKWTDTNTLGDSLLYEDLTRVIAPDEFQALAVRITDGTSNLLISVKDKQAIIESDVNLFLQPAGSGGTIVPKGVIEFEDIEGDKIHFFSHSYAISLDPFTFVFRSDQNFRWDTDTFSNRMYLSEEGNLTLAGNLISGTGEFDLLQFSSSLGNKIQMWENSYVIGVDEYLMYFQTDGAYEWRNFYSDPVMTLSEEGNLTLAGNINIPAGFKYKINNVDLSYSDIGAASAIHNIITSHTASGLTAGHFLKATSATQFTFAAHGLTYSDVGAPPTTRTITAGNGLTGGGDLSANRTVTLGTPSTVTISTSNSISTSSHTHAITITSSDIGAAPASHDIISNHTVSGLTVGHFLKATSATEFGFAAHGLTYTDVGAPPTSRTITAGNGLTGGGDLTADRTITLGTPSTLTSTTTNAVTTSSHTHSISGFAISSHTHSNLVAGNGISGTTYNGGTTQTWNIYSHAGSAGSIGTLYVSEDQIGVNLGTTSITAFRGDYGQAAYDHISSNGTSHTYIDQDVRTTANPTFNTLTSVLIGKDTAALRHIVSPSGAKYSNDESSIIGSIRIILPKLRSNTMMFLTIKIFNYVDGKSFTLNCGGYNYSTGIWYRTFAYVTGQTDTEYTVRFGENSTNSLIYIGEVNTYWSGLKVVVTDVVVAFSTYEGWESGWAIDVVTSFDTVRATLTSTLPYSDWNKIKNKPSTFPPEAHALVSSTHTASGLTAGHFLKATSATQFTFAAHGLTYSDVGAPPTTRTITAGNGLTGGGDLSANRTITLGTPGALTASTSNFVSLSSHTHSISGFSLDSHNHGTGTAGYIAKWQTNELLERSVISESANLLNLATSAVLQGFNYYHKNVRTEWIQYDGAYRAYLKFPASTGLSGSLRLTITIPYIAYGTSVPGGTLIYEYGFMGNSSGTAYVNKRECKSTIGNTADYVVAGDIVWHTTDSCWAIPIYNLQKRNYPLVSIDYYSWYDLDSAFTITCSSWETYSMVPSRDYSWINDRLAVGKSGGAAFTLDVNGDVNVATANRYKINGVNLNVVAGNGLTGGGDLIPGSTVTLGTPGTCTSTTTNAVTTSSHTHVIQMPETSINILELQVFS